MCTVHDRMHGSSAVCYSLLRRSSSKLGLTTEGFEWRIFIESSSSVGLVGYTRRINALLISILVVLQLFFIICLDANKNMNFFEKITAVQRESTNANFVFIYCKLIQFHFSNYCK